MKHPHFLFALPFLHANRMIHRESNQLIIGPYFIDDKGNVRAASKPCQATATFLYR